MITAVEIDELYYAEPIKTVTTPAAGLTGAEVATILKTQQRSGSRMCMVTRINTKKQRQV